MKLNMEEVVIGTGRLTRFGRGKASNSSKHATQIIELAPVLFKIKSILVPIDFSPASEKALAYAVPFASQFGAQLTVLYVLEPIATPQFAMTPLTLDTPQVLAKCKRHIERVIKDLEIEPKLIKRTLVKFGRPFNEIVSVARKLNTDLIIISTHGHTGMKRMLLGSTTERVVRQAPCPVFVVRPREREFIRRLNH
jgi:nucleotide-binding universal stress UspA family protein